jgi:hypothetical protein
MSLAAVCLRQSGIFSIYIQKPSVAKRLNFEMTGCRLDAQHLLWRLHTGYTIHPDIAIKQDMRVAELGTGTGYIGSSQSDEISVWSTKSLLLCCVDYGS